VTLAEGRAFELSGPDLGDVVRQPGPHCILQVYFLQHVYRPFLKSAHVQMVFNRVLKNKHQVVSQGARRFGKRSIFDNM
jgi:hypothetical protein